MQMIIPLSLSKVLHDDRYCIFFVSDAAVMQDAYHLVPLDTGNVYLNREF